MSELLSQNDPRWSGQLLGNGPLLIGPYGCYLTSMTMVANHGGANIDVPTLNEVFKQNGRFVDGDLLTDQSLNGLFGCEYVETLWYNNGPADLNVMKDTYEDEYIIELFINGNPNFTHFVRWVSGHSKATLQIANPWDGRIEYFKDVYGDPIVNIQKMVHYRVPNPTVPHQPEVQAIQEPTPVIEQPVVPTVEAPTVEPEPVPVIQNTEVAQDFYTNGEVPVTVVAPLPEYEATYVPDPRDITLIQDSGAIDLAGQGGPKALSTNQTFKVAGYLEFNGAKYWRGQTSADNNQWYAVPNNAIDAKDTTPSTVIRAEQETSKLAVEALHASAIYKLGQGLVSFLVKLFSGRQV